MRASGPLVIQGMFMGGLPRGRAIWEPSASAPASPGRALTPGAVQARFAQPAHAHNGAVVDPGLLGIRRTGGRPLPDAIQRKMQTVFGADFSSVRIHEGPQASAIGAAAFTVGSDIYFAPGRFRPETPEGQRLLGHELAHVLQQRAGRVRAPAGAQLAIVQDHALEAEADRMAQRAATMAQPSQGQAMAIGRALQPRRDRPQAARSAAPAAGVPANRFAAYAPQRHARTLQRTEKAEWQPTGGNKKYLEEVLNRGIHNGKPVYIHYTDQASFMLIGAARRLTDEHRLASRPTAKPGIYVSPVGDAMNPENAFNLLFLANETHANRGEYVFVFTSDAPVLSDQAISSTSPYREIILQSPIDLTGNLIYAGKNPFVDLFM